MSTRSGIFRGFWLVVATLSAMIGVALDTEASERDGFELPAPRLDEATTSGPSRTAILAGGCFWGVQGVFQHVSGVLDAESGYAGGTQSDAAYEIVGTGATGHAETVKITYDPKKISFGHLLQIYFSVAHDPTQLNRQGPDKGKQYRSTIFPSNAEQAKIAKAYIEQLSHANVYGRQIVTTIEPGKPFYPAEDYHQNFLTLNPTYPYILYVDMPKIRNLERLFPRDYRETPVLVKLPSSH